MLVLLRLKVYIYCSLLPYLTTIPLINLPNYSISWKYLEGNVFAVPLSSWLTGVQHVQNYFLKVNLMEQIYSAYKKNVQGKEIYFVKRFLIFPEYPMLEPVHEGYGMHSNFDQACHIAGISDPSLIARLRSEADGIPEEAKVVKMNPTGFSVKISR